MAAVPKVLGFIVFGVVMPDTSHRCVCCKLCPVNLPSEGLAVGVGFGAIGKTAAATFENARYVDMEVNSGVIYRTLVARMPSAEAQAEQGVV